MIEEPEKRTAPYADRRFANHKENRGSEVTEDSIHLACLLSTTCVRCLSPWSRGAARRRGPRTQTSQHIGEPLPLNSVPGTGPRGKWPAVSSAPRNPTQLASAASPMTWGCATHATPVDQQRTTSSRRLVAVADGQPRRRTHHTPTPASRAAAGAAACSSSLTQVTRAGSKASRRRTSGGYWGFKEVRPIDGPRLEHHLDLPSLAGRVSGFLKCCGGAST